ncbi:MAG: helix-turn-helix domain-containing protein [Gemmataceae bacterium]
MKPAAPDDKAMPDWTFLSNHAHVLLVIARDPEIRLRDVADQVGITERAVQRIVAELEDGRFLTRVRSGRRNRYRLHPDMPLRHPIEQHRTIAELMALVLSPDDLKQMQRESQLTDELQEK